MNAGQTNNSLAMRMREWMRLRNRVFSFAQICRALNVPTGEVRYSVFRTLESIVQRGEVEKIEQNRRQYLRETGSTSARKKAMPPGSRNVSFRYNHSWHRTWPAPLKKRILKAMRLISFRGNFSVADLQSLANAPERSYLDKLIKALVKEKYLSCVGARDCENRRGKEWLYRVADLDKFRIDLL